MKRAVFSLISILIILVIGLIVAPSFFDWNSYKSQATDAIKEQAGLDVILNGDIKIALIPAPYAYVNDVELRSVKEGNYANVATLKRLNLNLAVMPLLSGKVDFTAIELVEPIIRIETYADGSQNWQSDILKSKLEGNTPVDDANGDAAENAQTAPNSPSMIENISFNKIEITDGSIGFYNAASKSEQIIDNMDLTIKADTLAGPFAVDGSIMHQQRSVTFDAKTGRLGDDKSAIPVSVNASVTPDNVIFSYNGIVDARDAIQVQGETNVSIENLSEFMASMGVKNSPLRATKAELKGVLTGNAESFALKNAVFDFGASRMSGSVSGQINPLTIDLDLKSDTLEMSTLADIPALAQVKSAAVSGKLINTNAGFEAQNLVLRLDDTDLKGDIIVHAVAPDAKPKLTLKLSSQNLDLNKFIAAEPTAQNSGNNAAGNGNAQSGNSLRKTLESINIPVNADFDIALSKGRYSTYSFSGLKARGNVTGNTLVLNDFTIDNYADSAFSVKGRVDDYKALNGVDVAMSLKSANIKALADSLKIDISSIPADVRSADIALQSQGNAQAMDVTANIKALNGEIITSGIVSDLLGTIKTDGLDLQVKHRNFNEALNIVSPGSGSFDDFNKPLDFFAKVVKNDIGYDLQNIKANVAGIAVEGQAGLDMGNPKPFIRGDLRFGDVKIGNKTAGGKSAPSQGGDTNAPAPAGWSREAINSAWLNALNFDVNLVAKSLNYEGWDVAAPSMKAILNNGVLTMEQLQGGLYQGQVFLTGTLKQATQDTGYAVDGKVNLRDVSLEPLVGSLTGNRILTGRGLVSSDATIKTSGVSPSALIHALSGSGAVTGKEIVLTGFDLTRFARALSSEAKPGDTALGLWKGTTKGGSTAFDTLDGDFTINEGIVNISKMDLDGPQALLATTGKVDLPQFTITTVHEITLKDDEDFPPFKINISGPLNNPGQTFGQGVLNDYIARKVNRKLESFISDKLGDKLGFPQQQQQQQQQQQPAPSESNTEAAPVVPQDEQQQIEPAPQQQEEITPEKAIEGLIRGFIR